MVCFNNMNVTKFLIRVTMCGIRDVGHIVSNSSVFRYFYCIIFILYILLKYTKHQSSLVF